MTTVLLIFAVLAPLAGPEVARALRADGARVARTTTVALGLASTAAIALVVLAGLDPTGRPGGLADLPDWIDLDLDRASALLLATATGIALVVASFSRRALDPTVERVPAYFVAIGAVATGSALVVVPGGPIPLLAGWFIAGRGLLHLAGGWVADADATAAHRRLKTVLAAGDLALLAAIGVAIAAAGPSVVSGSSTAVADLDTTTWASVDARAVVAVLLVVAGAARSALFPFHRWLTATLYAPTPVSALVHAGFVSGAGLLLIRFAPTFSASTVAVSLAISLATITVLIGLTAALSRPDAKGALAWSTVAQMAFMVLQVAVGAVAAAVMHIVGHGMYKAAQFLGVGDTVGAELRRRRRPERTTPLRAGWRIALTALIATAAVAAGLAVGPQGLHTAEAVVLGTFAWAAVAAAVHGWLGTASLGRTTTVAFATLGAGIGAVGYFAGIRAAKSFLDPALPVVDPPNTAAVIVAVAAIATLAVVALAPGQPARWARDQWRWWVDALTAVRRPMNLRAAGLDSARPRSVPADETLVDDVPHVDRVSASHLQAQVARAAEIVAPSWPLASFVAVNPLSGFEDRSFDDATAEVGRWTDARTHRSLSEYRTQHEQGLTTSADLTYVALDVAMVACNQPTVPALGREVAALEVVLADLQHGPENPTVLEPRTALERRYGVAVGDRLGIDSLVSGWAADHVARPTWALSEPGSSFIDMARRQAIRHARRSLDTTAVAWLEDASDDPATLLEESLDQCGVRPTDRVDEIKGHLACVSGWVGLARWRTDWAHPDETTPLLRPIDLAAARAMLEAAVLVSLDAGHPVLHPEPGAGAMTLEAMQRDPLAERVTTAIEHLGLPSDRQTRDAVRAILGLVPESMRASIWLRAQEHHHESRLLHALSGPAAASATSPDAQVVFCIDVRSEGLRRHLESAGHDQTLGFAGFFGVPMQVQELGWSQPEARCPVLVAPSATVVEQPLVDRVADAAADLTRTGVRGAVAKAHAETKHVPGAAFTTAEALGWLTGPAAAWRTLLPKRFSPPTPTTTTSTRLGDEVGVEQRVFAAESVLRTMGLTEGFAPLVILSGHTSATENNAHATALECGACAGASGASNARAVASLLNEADVRAGLAARGIDIPDETWFGGALHDTASDHVAVLDRHLAPETHLGRIDALQGRLDEAGERQARDRTRQLPGAASVADTRARGGDWAQARPEWGLAGNAAFVIGPRAMTAGLDLDGRAFLHSYDAEADPDGGVLEAIMTAPLIVGHWISAQYYFSTVDPERFGAGDKLLHNPIGSVGVITGAGGDLRVGLPTQSTHVGDQPHHQPLRLLAVVQADLATVESIITRNEVLHRLVRGGWLHIAARPGFGEPWSTRSPGGTWSELPADVRLGQTVRAG